MSALEDSKPVLMLPAALWWAGKGVPVFPLHNAVLTPTLDWACSCGDPCRKDSPAKHPRTAHGVNDATTDPKIITGWWERWPEANVGLACGVKFDLLDIDGPVGFEMLAKLEAELGPLKPLSVVQSGRKEGGRHYYLSPPGLGNLSGNITSPAGIDVKSVGGYAVAPPSQHITGYRYEMTQLFALHDEDNNWPEVHARLRELAPKKPKVEASNRPAVPAEHRSEQWRKRARSWCAKALTGVAGNLAEMPDNSGRNNYLNAQTWRMLRFAHAGHLETGDVLDAMRQAAEDSGLSHTEIETTLRSAINGADKEGPLDPNIGEDTDFDPFAGLDDKPGEDVTPVDITSASPPSAPTTVAPVTAGKLTARISSTGAVLLQGDDEAFWTSRPVLEHVRTHARALQASPYAVLGVVLCRIVTLVPPHFTLPALVGDAASLNLFVALVGPSGGGKGAAERAAGNCLLTADVEESTVGSGEGIGHLYAHREKGEVVRDRDAVLFTIPEVDNLTALGQRQGATLLPQLRSAWSGEQLGFAYADKSKALPIKRHTYRMGLVLGVQPGRAAALLDDADGGTPQRFLWFPVSDLHAQLGLERPPQRTWEPPSGVVNADPFSKTVEMPIPPEVRLEVGMQSLSRLRGEDSSLDGHRGLARLKAAAALALFDGRREMNLEDWQLAAHLLDVSDVTRGCIVAHLSERFQRSNAARGEAEGERAIVVAETVAAAAARRVARRIVALVRDGEQPWSEVRRRIAARDRQYIEEALARLEEAGQVTTETREKALYVRIVS